MSGSPQESVAWHGDEREKEIREAVEFMRLLKADESLPSNIRASAAMLEARFEQLTGDEFVPVDYLLERERLLQRALTAPPAPDEAVRKLVGLMAEVIPALEATGVNVSLVAQVREATNKIANQQKGAE